MTVHSAGAFPANAYGASNPLQSQGATFGGGERWPGYDAYMAKLSAQTDARSQIWAQYQAKENQKLLLENQRHKLLGGGYLHDAQRLNDEIAQLQTGMNLDYSGYMAAVSDGMNTALRA